MIIRHDTPDTNFTILDNLTIRDHRLSWAARGILAYLLSMPPTWRTSAERLAAASPNGVTYVRSALKELETNGYLRRRKTQDERGQWTTELFVYGRPNRTRVETLGEIVGKTHQPTTGKPTSENLTPNKELTTKDLVKDYESLLGTQPELCGHCQGNGIILDGFAGLPTFCPDCKGDGIKRP
jgi:DNA-binding MarR family transcriptional regulator